MVGSLASASSTTPISSGFSSGPAHAPAHVYDGNADTVTLDSAALMFRGTYAHAGPDLAITGPGGEKALIVGYFAAEHPATLVSPDGAILTGETVTQLAGARFVGAYAEAGPAQTKAPIGQVETATGVVTITHADGTKVTGAAGTAVFEGDIVETDGAGRVSITFADKTVASLGESARIVLDKFVYDPAGSGNSMLLNLVHGAFVFVAGLVAPTGDMRIETPVATMGIRGTTGVVRADIQDGTSYFTLKPDPPGKLGGPGGHVGAFDVFARLDGVLIKEVRVPDQLLIVHNASGKFDDLTAADPKEAAFEQQILDFAFAAHQHMLERIESGQQPLSPDVKPQQPQPGQNNGNTTPDDHSKDAGLNTTPGNFDTLRNPLDVDLLKQTDPLGNETNGTGTSQGGNTSNGTGGSQTGGLLAPPVEFTNAPITVGFYQQSAEDGIQGRFPITFTGGATTPAITQTVATVSTIAFGVGSNPPHPFSLTSDQIAAIANAYDPATGTLSLALDTTFLGAGQQVILTVNVTISDGLTSATQSLVFAIVGLNDAPTLPATTFALDDTSGADRIGAPAGQLVATDPDQDAALTYKITGQTADANGVTRITTAYGTLTLTADGHYTFTPDGAALDTLAPGETQHIEIQVEVSDGIAPPATSVIAIDFTGANDAPTLSPLGLAIVDTSSADTLTPLTGQLAGTDPDSNATLAYTIAGQSVGEGGTTSVTTPYGTLTLTADGHYTFTPDGAAINGLAAGETQHIEIPVSVSDGIAPPATSIIAIDLTGANDAPALSPRALTIADTSSADTLTPLTGQLAGTDPDSNATLAYTIVGQSVDEGGTTSITTPYGTLTLTAEGHYTFTPDSAAINGLAAGETQHIEIPVAVSDGIAPPATSLIAIDLTGANDAPTLAATSLTVEDSASSHTSAPLAGQLAGADADHNATLTYTLVGRPADDGGATSVTTPYGTLTLSIDGHYTFTPDSAAVDALAAGETHHLEIAAAVSDGIAPPTTSTIAIDVIGANDAPQISADGLTGTKTLGGTTTVSGTTYTFTHDGIGEAGAVWQQVDLAHDAHWGVRAYFGNGPAGNFGGTADADGIVFAFQNTGTSAIGGGGGSLGISGGVPDAVGFKIDTYPFNTGDTGSSQFIQFFTQANIYASAYAQQLTALLNDGNTHTLDVDWNAAAKTLTYTLDGTYYATLTRDIAALDFGGDTSVYGGFVAASGAANSKTSVAFDAMANGSIGLIAEREGTVDSNEMRSISGSVYFTDADHGATHTISVAAPGTDTFGGLTAHLVSDASGEGRIEWTYAVRDGALDSLADGETVNEIYHVAVNDGLATTTTDVKITLVGRSDPYLGGDSTPDPTQLAANDNALSQSIHGSGESDLITLAMRADGVIRSGIDGGGGTDALVLAGSYGDVDLTALSSGQIKNIEQINIAQGSAQTLKLSLDSVLDMSGAADYKLDGAIAAYNVAHPGHEITISADHALIIDGDHGPTGDIVEIVSSTANTASGSWSNAGTVDYVDTVSAGTGPHDVYNFTTTAGEVLATIAVHHDVEVAQHAAAA